MSHHPEMQLNFDVGQEENNGLRLGPELYERRHWVVQRTRKGNRTGTKPGFKTQTSQFFKGSHFS